MTEEVLTIREGYTYDDSVESFQYIEIDCDNGTGNLNNETDLTITCQNKSAWLYPHASYLRIDGNFKTADGANVANNSAVAFTNNGLMYLFSNFKYYLEGKQIEYFQNVGITTTIHNYLTKSRNYAGGSWFWLPDRGTTAADALNGPWRTRNFYVNPQAAGGVWNFSAIVPLNVISNFCNDYRKVLYGMQHKISLNRTNSTRALLRTNNAVAAAGIHPALVALADDITVNITTLKWCMPKVTPSLVKQQELLSIIKDKEPVPMAFFNKRSESIIVPAATKFTWKLHLSGGIERPRGIVIAFQTGRGEDQTTNNASFDVAGLNVIDAYVLLDGDRYPLSNVATNYVDHKYARWYHEYTNFYNKYNNDNKGEACLSYFDFLNVAPIYVFDISNQPERVKNTQINVSLELTFADNPPDNTIAYAVTYFDSMYILVSDGEKQLTEVIK